MAEESDFPRNFRNPDAVELLERQLSERVTDRAEKMLVKRD